MGDIADMMLDGTLCQGCGEYIGEGDGYPTYCPGCAPPTNPQIIAMYSVKYCVSCGEELPADRSMYCSKTCKRREYRKRKAQRDNT